jgi:hypothetical protein
MGAVRRGAWVVLKYVTSLFFVGVIVQFFLVGYGLFDMKNSATSPRSATITIDNANSLNAHRAVGFLLSDLGALLMLILVLLAWPPTKLLVRWIVLVLLAFVQGLLAGFGFNHWVIGMFHPVVALILLGLSGHLALYAWKADRSADKSPEAIVEAG